MDPERCAIDTLRSLLQSEDAQADNAAVGGADDGLHRLLQAVDRSRPGVPGVAKNSGVFKVERRAKRKAWSQHEEDVLKRCIIDKPPSSTWASEVAATLGRSRASVRKKWLVLRRLQVTPSAPPCCHRAPAPRLGQMVGEVEAALDFVHCSGPAGLTRPECSDGSSHSGPCVIPSDHGDWFRRVLA